ncbi:MAG: Hsp20/alpha crystallin family protein [Candidatus Aureabacteria bacterium]|nr:Hsp20/alpha crystallin family protein [Candidatus Auribacterota bacterium]
MKNTKILIGIVIFLVLGLFIQTAYLFHIKGRLDEKDANTLNSKPGVSILPNNKPSYNRVFHFFGNDFDSFFSKEWDPFEEMERIQKEMNRMFRNSFGRGLLQKKPALFIQEHYFDPDIDIRDDKTHYIITMDIPGMDKDKINIEIKNRHLIVSGERKSETEEKSKGSFYRKERSFGSFSRTIPLPEDASSKEISAEYKKGVLTIKIPKQEEKKEEKQRETVTII